MRHFRKFFQSSFLVLIAFPFFLFIAYCNAYSEPIFKNEQDYLDFYLSQTVEFEALKEDLDISNRSYLFNVDFTYSPENGLKVIEYNGTIYPLGFINRFEPRQMLSNFIKFKMYLDWELSLLGLPEILAESGTDGHFETYRELSVKRIYQKVLEMLAEEYNLKKIYPHDLSVYPIKLEKKMIKKMETKSSYVNLVTEAWNKLNLLPSDDLLKGNHYAVDAFARSKALMNLLPMTIQSSNQLVIDTHESNTDRIKDYLNSSDSKLFIVKPDTGFQSQNVHLVGRDELTIDFLSSQFPKEETLIVQTYTPSSPTLSIKNQKLKSPVGRAYYSLTFYNGKVSITPISLYWKMGNHNLNSETDLWDSEKMNFSTIEHGQELASLEQLSLLTKKLNSYFKVVGPSLLEIFENGLSGKSTIANDIRKRFHNLPYHLQMKVLRQQKDYIYQFFGYRYNKIGTNYSPRLQNPLSFRKNSKFCKKSASKKD